MYLYDILIDFTFASILIVFGQFLRSKVSFFQKFFIPASLIAAFLGLLLGKQGLEIIHFSKCLGSYAGLLTIIVFSAIGLNGFTTSKSGGVKADVKRIVTYQMYRVSNVLLQYAIPIIFTILVISKIYPNVNYGFGMLLAAGFAGGHGTAAAVGSAFADLGFLDATNLAMTSATVGLLAGIFGGLAFIKYGTKKGYTCYIKDFSYISGDLRTGLISKESRNPVGMETISNVSLDPVAWHLCLLMIPSGLGYMLNTWIKAYGITAPNYAVAFILAFFMFLIIRKTKVNDYIDKKIIKRLSGTATDYLVFFGVASIKIPVVIKYAGPLMLLFLCGFILVFLCMTYFGPAFNKDSWFERSLFVYGYSTGVFAIGFVLLRIVDPENLSKTLGDIALTSPLNESIAVVILSAGPIMLMTGGHWIFVGALLLGALVSIIISIVIGAWYRKIPLKDRVAIDSENT